MRRPESVPGPAGLDHWHPNEITEWLTGGEDDQTVADADVYRARMAVHALGAGNLLSAGCVPAQGSTGQRVPTPQLPCGVQPWQPPFAYAKGLCPGDSR